jgi:hypothetical protein
MGGSQRVGCRQMPPSRDGGAGARSSVDRALASGARGRKFESCRARVRKAFMGASMSTTDLHEVIVVKSMATALAASADPGPDEALEIVAGYERARQRAKMLNDRAWPGSSFDAEVPPSTPAQSVHRLPRGMEGHQAITDAQARGKRAMVLSRQLAAWAEGHQEAFEIEARLAADVAAKAKQQQSKGNVGFG